MTQNTARIVATTSLGWLLACGAQADIQPTGSRVAATTTGGDTTGSVGPASGAGVTTSGSGAVGAGVSTTGVGTTTGSGGATGTGGANGGAAGTGVTQDSGAPDVGVDKRAADLIELK